MGRWASTSGATIRDVSCSSSSRPRATTRSLSAPLFAGFALLETQWQGIPQLWVQTPGVDFTLADRVRGRDGVHAQWVMSKDLNPT